MTTVLTDDADFFSQVVNQLQQSDSILAALGQTDATPKIFSDVAQGSPALPYLVITEQTEQPQYQSADAAGNVVHFDRGTITAHVFAPGKAQARAIGRLIAGQLNDAPIAPDDGILLELRYSNAAFVPIGDIAPGSSTVYCRVIVFTYMMQREN